MVGLIRDSIAAPVDGVARTPWDQAIDASVRREETNSCWLDSFQNSAGNRTDDQMLTDAMTYATAQTQPPVIKLGARDHSFTTTGRNVYPGFALAGPADPGLQTAEQSSKGAKARALFNGGSGTSSMFYANGGGAGASIYNAMTCTNISWYSTNNVSQWLHAPLSAVNMYGVSWGNLQFRQFLYCIGQPNDAATITLGTMWGSWNIPNMAGTPLSFRGSDNWLVPDQANIGWLNGPTAAYLVRFENMQKTFVRGLYLTCNQGTTRAMLVDNQDGAGDTQGSLMISDCVIEGQNNGQPAAGALVYVNSHGVVNLHHCAINFAMANPTPFTPDDTAHIIANLGTSGLLNVHDINFTRATNVSQDVPFVEHQGTGRTYVKKIYGQKGNGGAGQAWTDLPAVKQTGTGYMEIDNSVRLV